MEKIHCEQGRACYRQGVGNLRCNFLLLDISVLPGVVYPLLNV